MKAFDIEKYTRTVLKGHTLQLSAGGWEELSAKLDEEEKKKIRNLIFRKAALFITVFILGLGFIKDKPSIFPVVEVNRSLDNIEQSDILFPSDIETQNNAPELVATSLPQNRDVSTSLGKNQKLDKYLTGRAKESSYKMRETYNQPIKESSIYPKMHVTDAEIDSLLRTARENLQLENLLLKQEGKRVLTEEEILAHADIKIEVEPDFYNRDVSFNKVLLEFLKIKSVFAN